MGDSGRGAHRRRGAPWPGPDSQRLPAGTGLGPQHGSGQGYLPSDTRGAAPLGILPARAASRSSGRQVRNL